MNHKRPGLYMAMAVVGIVLVTTGMSVRTVLWIGLAGFMMTMHMGGHRGHGGGNGSRVEGSVPAPDHDTGVPVTVKARVDHHADTGPK